VKRLCAIALVLLASACSSETSIIVDPEVLEVTHENIDVELCNCLHGCGPGMSGSLRFDVRNAGSHSHAVAYDGFVFSRDDGGSYTDLERGHPFNNSPPLSLEPGQTERMTFTVQLDVAAFHEGPHEVEFRFLVDDAPVPKSMSLLDLHFVPNDYCDAN
jgi:hypothetical protein